MASPSYRLRRTIAASFCLPLTMWANGALSRQVCVVCTGPEASYRCVVEGGTGSVTPAARLACITTLAREGSHETCGVKGSQSASLPCEGPERKVSVPDAAIAPVQAPLAVPSETRPADKVTPPPAPKTVEELARQVTKSSGEQVKSAGSTIGEAARKTWGCISSFFKSC